MKLKTIKAGAITTLFAMIASPQSIVVLGGFGLFIIVAALMLVGVIVAVVLGTLITLLPALIVGGIVYWFTGSELYGAVAFLLIALSGFMRKRK